MILEGILLIILLYILHIQYSLYPAEATRNESILVPSEPKYPILSKPTGSTLPKVSVIDSKDDQIVIAVKPAWYDPVELPPTRKIRLPVNYKKDSPVDVRTFECLSVYRYMKNKTQKIDFVSQPFIASIDNTETAVVILNELAHQIGTKLSFSEKAFQYDDSDYRTACGISNLGTIHSILAQGNNSQTANFRLHLKLDFNEITSSPQNLRNFTLRLINDLTNLLGCRKEFIRVLSIARTNSIHVNTGLTTSSHEQTKQLAEQLVRTLNGLTTQQRNGVLQYLISEAYNYTWGPAITFLQLQESDFDPRFNRDYPYAQEEKRGGRPYYFPQGWYRHALKVNDKYSKDQAWLGMNNSPGEWAVAYHGTKYGAVKDIIATGLKHNFVTTDFYAAEAKRQLPTIPDVKGLYLATHCERGASLYAGSGFKVEGPPGTIKTYYIVFQCRVQNGKFTEHTGPVSVGTALRVFDEKAIRPYGLLLKAQ